MATKRYDCVGFLSESFPQSPSGRSWCARKHARLRAPRVSCPAEEGLARGPHEVADAMSARTRIQIVTKSAASETPPITFGTTPPDNTFPRTSEHRRFPRDGDGGQEDHPPPDWTLLPDQTTVCIFEALEVFGLPPDNSQQKDRDDLSRCVIEVHNAALWISGAYGIAFSRELSFRPTNSGLLIIVAIVVGGALAWILRDISAALERFRR